tara:strand:- start:138 stop:695 length:558 start_codon:yes stop_codon:yes gene_type:complete
MSVINYVWILTNNQIQHNYFYLQQSIKNLQDVPSQYLNDIELRPSSLFKDPFYMGQYIVICECYYNNSQYSLISPINLKKRLYEIKQHYYILDHNKKKVLHDITIFIMEITHHLHYCGISLSYNFNLNSNEAVFTLHLSCEKKIWNQLWLSKYIILMCGKQYDYKILFDKMEKDDFICKFDEMKL